MTQEEIEAYEMGLLERRMRIEFAELNGRGTEWFDTRRADYTTAYDHGPAATKRSDERRLLVRNGLEMHEDKAASQSALIERHSLFKINPLVADADTKTKELLRLYNDMNEMIVLNEEVLEIECNQFASLAETMNAHEAAVFQSENEELRVLIEGEYVRRSVAVATLIVHVFRDRQTEMSDMIESIAATDSLDAQCSLHKRCAGLASDAAKSQAKLEELQAEVERLSLDSISRKQREDAIVRAAKAIEELEREQLRALERLVHVDGLVWRILAEMMTSKSS